MKKLKTPISLLLAVIMLAAGFAVPVSAAGMTADDWNSYYYDETGDALKGLIMQPGSDESSRSFSWYADKDAAACEVKISDNEDMRGAKTFTGALDGTYQGDKRARVTVTGLEAETEYFYTCISDGYESDVYSFTTEGDGFSAMFVTDIHISGETDSLEDVKKDALTFGNIVSQAKEVSKANGREITTVLSAGDQASSGFRSEYIGLTASEAIKSVDFATSIGNHDRKGVDYKFFKSVPNEYNGLVNSYQGGDYWFTKGDVLFMVMDSNNGSGVDHHSFMQKAIAKNPDAKWRVCMMHHDLWGQTLPHREQENEFLRLLWTPLFDEFNVDLVLLGHSHCYSVSNIMYNKESVTDLRDGYEITNAKGTVYMVSGSLTRPRSGDYTYGSNIGIGIDDSEKIVYNIIDFNGNDITVTTYDAADASVYASFRLVKNEENKPVKIAFWRVLFSRFADLCGTIFAVFNNISVTKKLKDKGYDISYLKTLFNTRDGASSPMC